jgi:hypothetical protein
MAAREFVGFSSWGDVLLHVEIGWPLYYQAPLDYRPYEIRARKSGARVRVKGTREFDAFWTDEKHLDRFRKPVTEGGRNGD